MEKKSTETSVETHTTQNKGIDDTNDYSIYYYLKEHPAIFITLVSAIIATITTLINFLTHMYLVMAYRSWNIPPVLFNQDQWTYIYYCFVSTLIYCVSVCFVRELIEKSYLKWYKSRNRIKSLLNLYRVMLLRKENRAQYHALNAIKKENRNREALNEVLERIFSEKKELLILEKDIAILHLQLLFDWNSIIPMIGASLGLLFSVVVMVMMTGQWSLRDIFLIWMFSWCGFFVSSLFLAKLAYPEYSRKSIKRFIKDKRKSVSYDEATKELLGKYGSDEGKTNKFYSNNGIKRVATMAATGLFSLFVGITAMVLLSPSKRPIATYRESDELYAVAYYTGSTYVLEEAKIEEDTLYVNTDEQRIISDGSDMSFTYMSFKNVILLSERSGSDKTMFESEAAPIV